jgi:hypothetical protein
MCDIIIMPDGTEIESFEGENTCMCQKTQAEIISYIAKKLPTIEYGKKIIIEHDFPGYWVKIEDMVT